MDTFTREEILKMNKNQMDTFMDNQKRMSDYNEGNFPLKTAIEEAYAQGVQEAE